MLCQPAPSRSWFSPTALDKVRRLRHRHRRVAWGAGSHSERGAVLNVHELVFGVTIPFVDLWRFGRRVEPLRRVLAEREQWDPERLRSWQVERLREILIHCDRRVPFYRRRFRECGFDPSRFEDPSQLAGIPFLTKEDIRAHTPELFAEGVSRRGIKRGRTGGSTGEPTAFFQSREEAAWFEAVVRRCYDWLGIRPGERIVKIAGLVYWKDWRRPVIDFVNTYFRNLRSLPAPSLSDELIESYIRRLNQMRPPVLYGYPSAMELLSRRIVETGQKVPSVRVVWTSSEALLDSQRTLIREAFGVEPFDGYGGAETPIAIECEAHKGLHVFQHAKWVEVVDDEGRPVAPGAAGRVLVTLFHNRVWPFVRYDTGDIAEVMPEEEPCPCGVRLPRFRRVQGRTGDILVTADGRRVTIANVTLVFGAIHAHVRAYQLYQETPEVIEVRIVRTPTFTTDTESYVERSLRRFLGPHVRLAFRYVEDIEVTPAGKRRILVSRVSETGAAGRVERVPTRP